SLCRYIVLNLNVSSSYTVAEVKVNYHPGGIKLSCDKRQIYNATSGEGQGFLLLDYKDENTDEYTCVNEADESDKEPKIYVKFRTCDNCIELDLTAILGIVIGDVVATIAIGVGVYLLLSQSRLTPMSSHKKSSDRQHLVPNEVSSSRGPNDQYERLRYKGAQKDMYDVIQNRR
uniref:T-cell surface glycoprotein CD3 delta chain-like n=1 Tax=Mastacembelus armatus TaxID=205130 RepID=A0A3Q3KSS5_9TELE